MTTPQQIKLQEPLPCGIPTATGCCHQPTYLAYITPDITDTVPDEGGYFRLLPVCSAHLAEMNDPPTLISEFDQTFTGRANWEWE